MNKIVASLGMAAIGASSIHAVMADDLGAPASKPWSIAASLRGFYDDNINGSPSGQEVQSWGYELSPAASLVWKQPQTSIDLNYIYSYRYFEKERFIDAGHNSQSHLFKGTIDHTFSERYALTTSDWFAIGQEPDLQRNPTFGITPSPYPISGNNIHNFGTINFDAQMTPLLGFQVGYDNSYFNYEDSGAVFTNGAFLPSLSGLFDRIEQTAHINANWNVQRETVAFVGYQFGWINYTADEFINVPGTSPFVKSQDKDNHSHYIYVGANHYFLPTLYATLTAGGRFIDFNKVSETDSSPYVRALMRYLYCPESYIEAGFSYDLSMTGVADAQSAEATVFYVDVRHRIIPKFFASLNGQIQNSTLQGGANNNDKMLYYTLGLNLEYQFARHFSANIGYDFDKVDADVGTSYTRNRVYFGITASY